MKYDPKYYEDVPAEDKIKGLDPGRLPPPDEMEDDVLELIGLLPVYNDPVSITGTGNYTIISPHNSYLSIFI